jgi:hypothetical protein
MAEPPLSTWGTHAMHDRSTRRAAPPLAAALLALPILLAIMVSCSKAVDTSAGPATTAPPPSTMPPTTKPAEDFEAQATDFTNLADMTPVRGFFVANKLGHLDDALAVANAGSKGGTYPVGTIIQLVPGEAMVKRKAGFDPTLGDWEFFQLKVGPTGTEIQKRGGPEVVNFTGLSCGDCHKKADPKFDFVCEHDHGCDPLPITDAQFKVIQMTDPRPK